MSEDDRRLLDLVSACTRGDHEAFRVLYQLTWRRVYSRAYLTVRDVAQAQEVTQEVYLDLWATVARYDPKQAPVVPYLLMLAHRHAVSRVRTSEAARRRDSNYARTSGEREYDDTSETAMLRVEAADTRHLLETLTAVQREAIYLSYFGGHTHYEIAELVSAPVGTIKSRIHEGILRLRRAAGATS